MITLCVWTGEKYGREYIERLRQIVPGDLLCITDKEDHIPGVEKLVPPPKTAGWWLKLWAFSEEVPHPCLVLDLDIMALSPLNPFYKGDGFRIIRDFYPGGGRANINSSIMLLPHARPEIWDDWKNNSLAIERTYPTDQHYLLAQSLPWNFYPDSWTASYRRSVLTPETKVVVFHGEPKPHQVQWNPVRGANQFLPE